MVPDGSLARVPGLPELAALGDELRRSCSLAAAGNRGEAEEGHGRRRLRGARRRRSRGAATIARERDGGIGLLGVCVVANKKKEAALAGNREERWGAGAAARVRGAPAGPWAGLGWPGLRGRLGCKALFSLSKENKNKTEIGKKRGRG